MFDGRFAPLLIEYRKSERAAYFNQAVSRIERARAHGPVVVFVDPDTGIEPRSGGDSKHLLIADLVRLAGLVRAGDKLIVYQHAPIMRKKSWIDDAVNRIKGDERFARLELQAHHDNECASDVCFIKFER